jgi:DeoR/GlpR family transcriptional regulator of sugar metabolism
MPICFLWASPAFTDRAGFTTGDYEEAGYQARAGARAAETVVMASQEKLNSASAFAIGELGLASTLIIDTCSTRRCGAADQHG